MWTRPKIKKNKKIMGGMFKAGTLNLLREAKDSTAKTNHKTEKAVEQLA